MIKLSRPRKARPAARPRRGVAAHRLFPLAAALWCAALFALCCLAAGAESLGALSLKLHLPAIVPAAAPPLGMTARALLVALSGLGGAVAGLVIGWRLQARALGPIVVRARPSRSDEADDAADAEPVVAEPPIRAGAPRVRSRDAHPDAPPRRPLVVTEDVLPFAATSRFVTPEPTEPADTVIEVAPRAADVTDDLPAFLADALRANRAEANEPEFTPEPEAEVAPEPVAEAPAPAPEPVFVIPELPLATRAAAEPQLPIGEAPIESLGLVQLIERLAQAIATRQTLRAEREAAAADAMAMLPDPRAPLHRFDPLTMDPVGPLLRAKPRRDAAPMAEFDPAEIEDAVEPVADTDPDSDDPLAGEHRYASLAAMAMPRPDLIGAVDAAPAEAPAAAPVVHLHPTAQRGTAVPVAEPEADTGEDPDRALRDALATLRRISGQR